MNCFWGGGVENNSFTAASQTENFIKAMEGGHGSVFKVRGAKGEAFLLLEERAERL